MYIINERKLLNIESPTIHCLTLYLDNQLFGIRVNFTRSQAMNRRSGVPQGSVLGCLLSLICINGLPQQALYDLLLSTDDVTLWREFCN